MSPAGYKHEHVPRGLVVVSANANALDRLTGRLTAHRIALTKRSLVGGTGADQCTVLFPGGGVLQRALWLGSDTVGDVVGTRLEEATRWRTEVARYPLTGW